MTGWGMSSQSPTLSQIEAAVISALKAGVQPHDLSDHIWAREQELVNVLGKVSGPTDVRAAWLSKDPISGPRTKLINPIRCHTCREKIDIVPCVKCSPWDGDADEDDNLELRECPTPTDAKPGTIDKILVMRARLEAGYSVFCEGDAVWQKAAS